MTLSAALISLILLFLIVFTFYFIWRDFFSYPHLEEGVSASGLKGTPEWAALRNTREEIDDDPLLESESRSVLLGNWHEMAEEIKQRMDEVDTQQATSSLPKPSRATLLIIGPLVVSVALLFTWANHGIHGNWMKWPQGLGLSADRQVDTVDQAVAASSGHPGDGTSMKARIKELESRLANNPHDLEGWVLLARSRAAMGEYKGSAQALREALKLSPGHPVLLADLADMVAMSNGKSLLGEPEKYIAQALKNDPTNEKALALAATAAEQAGDKTKAAKYWQRLEQVQQAALEQEQQSNQQASGQTPVAEQSRDSSSKPTPLIKTDIEVPAGFAKNMSPRAALFVFVKGQPGPGMPLAVVRVPLAHLKEGSNSIGLSNGDFIQGGDVNSLPDPIFIQARLAASGTPAPDPNDLTSQWAKVSKANLTSDIKLVLKP